MCARWIAGLRALLPALTLAAAAGTAQAHKASDAYLRLATGDAGLRVVVDVALRDLDLVVDLDRDGDGAVTWGEVRAAWPAIVAYVGARLRIAGCPLAADGKPALERRGDGSYASLVFDSPCKPAHEPAIGYTLLHEVDATHRGIARFALDGRAPVVRLLDPGQATEVLAPTGDAGAFFAEGIHHIVTGWDHLLFLLCLLLPAAMRRGPLGWQPVARRRDAVLPVAGIVTAFTLAHSITLALAALGLVAIPASLIEPAIAATIVLAAADNLRPIFGRRRGVVTFLFGLVHGFGFAGVLGELALAPGEFAWALLRFNLGLEFGQLAIVGVAAGLLFALRGARGYPRWAIGGGSVAAIALGAAWFVERTAGIVLLPI